MNVFKAILPRQLFADVHQRKYRFPSAQASAIAEWLGEFRRLFHTTMRILHFRSMKLCFLCVFLLQSRTAYVKSHTYLLVPLLIDKSVFETIFFLLLIFNMSFLCDITYQSQSSQRDLFKSALVGVQSCKFLLRFCVS